MVSSGRKGQGRVSTVRIGYLESFQQAPGQRSCPSLSDAGLGVRGQGDRGSEAQVKERAPTKVFAGVGSRWGCLPMKGVWQASCLLALEID